MAEAATPSITHEPPSLPSSPHHKRTKLIDPTPTAASIAGEQRIFTALVLPKPDEVLGELFCDSGRATPTPISTVSSNPTMAQTLATSEAPPPLQVQLLGSKGRAPTKGSAFAAGYDLYSSEDTVVPARGKAMVSTSIAIAVPIGTCKFTSLLV